MRKRIQFQSKSASPLLSTAPTPASVQTSPDQLLTTQTLALEFKKRGLPVPHRNSILLAEKNLRFPKRFHLGGPWSPAIWKKAEIEAYFTEAVEERPPLRWRPRAELEKELAEMRGIRS